MPRTKYSVHVVPMPCSTTSFPLRCNLLFMVDHFAGGTGGGVGGAGGGGVGATPHHLAFPPELHVPRHWSSDIQPGFVLQRPQLHLSSHAYPHAGALVVPSLEWQVPGYPGDGGGGVGVGGVGLGGAGDGPTPPHHFALPPPLHGPKHVSFAIHPGFVLHRPQLQLASQL